ncbi:MAG: signal peptidase II [Roseovarius sp.]|nr:signal peptidase II [Roseovarius sp.]
MRRVFWAALAVFLADQASKYWVVHMLGLDRLGRIEVWPPYLNLRMAWNYGINFGLFADDHPAMRWVLIAFALAISGVVLWWLNREGGGRWQEIAAGVLIGGAMGNAVDRLLYGAVADFLNMSCCGIDNPYAFNVADIAVFAGAVGMVVFGAGKKPA